MEDSMRQLLFVLFILVAAPVSAQNTLQHNGITYAVVQPHTSYLWPGGAERKLGYRCAVTFERWLRITTCTWEAVVRITNNGPELAEGGREIHEQRLLPLLLIVVFAIVGIFGSLLWVFWEDKRRNHC
jgi:hypothetical protein